MSFSDLYFSREPGALRSTDVSYPMATPPATFSWGSILGFNPWRARPPVTPPPAFVLPPVLSSLLARRREWNRNTDHGRNIDPMGWQGSLKDQRRWEEHKQINASFKEECSWPDEPPVFTAPDWNRGATTIPEEIMSPRTTSTNPRASATEIEEVQWGTWHYNTGMRSDDSFSCSDESLAFFLGTSYKPGDSAPATPLHLDYGDEDNVIGHTVTISLRESERNQDALATADTPLFNPEQQTPPFAKPRRPTLLLNAADACHARRGFEDVPATPVTVEVATAIHVAGRTSTAARLDVAVAVPITKVTAVQRVSIVKR